MRNKISTLLIVIAILAYLGGFIIALDESAGFRYFEDAIVYLAAGFVSGTMFLGFAEIINLLDKIYYKTLSKDGLKEVLKQINNKV